MTYNVFSGTLNPTQSVCTLFLLYLANLQAGCSSSCPSISVKALKAANHLIKCYVISIASKHLTSPNPIVVLSA